MPLAKLFVDFLFAFVRSDLGQSRFFPDVQCPAKSWKCLAILYEWSKQLH